MSRYEILPCRARHIAEISRNLRAEDRAEIENAGLHPRHFLFRLYSESTLYRRAALIDGEVAAVWGDQAPLLSTEGHLWLLTAPPIERLPLAFFRETRREIRERLAVRSMLRADAASGYGRALRFFAMLGFEVLDVGSDGSTARRELRIERGY